MDQNFGALPDSGRMINPALGGGSLLDMSAYPSVRAMSSSTAMLSILIKTSRCSSPIKQFTLALEWT
ncbi:hypothetical protein I314_06283 [Cryptococcus bacillisporus CA1873]|uniref:Uncharacterized protein n=1 Tax=Cryptococcus bacillisporus CA1873 TaxID=1296111 RepID=A0ABR5B2G4_CRYGA|nr:hypothetical protein I314_06283 [Cryptococcus bacillisporus CA1873]|eukprot:KIR57779.1 hypothetical protein I314_06283 [Cryptococcus gattii CA1873]